jgi:hypothetical protein
MAMNWHSIRLGGVSLLALFALSCDQPPADCTTGHGGFAATYTLKSKQGMGACDRLEGDIIGLEKYNPAQESDAEKQDLTKAKLRIRPQKLSLDAEAEWPDLLDSKGFPLDSVGDFVSTTPDEESVCSVPMMSEASMTLQSGAEISYSWSNVKIFVTTAYPGTQMTADLVYSEGECSATYRVVGLWPAVGCDDGMGKPAPELCDPQADPANGRPTGSGINPDFEPRVECHPELLLCVLREVPEGLN